MFFSEVTMNRSYPSDVSRTKFDKIKPLLESVRKTTRPGSVDLYDVFCGVLYILKSGCRWRMLPKEYPKWERCYYYLSLWKHKNSPSSESVLEKVLKKIGWRGPTKQWSERKNEFCNH